MILPMIANIVWIKSLIVCFAQHASGGRYPSYGCTESSGMLATLSCLHFVLYSLLILIVWFQIPSSMFTISVCRHAGPCWESWQLINTSMSGCPMNQCQLLPSCCRVFCGKVATKTPPSLEGSTSLIRWVPPCCRTMRMTCSVIHLLLLKLLYTSRIPWLIGYSSSTFDRTVVQ
jgi:hypothetical protein